MSSQKIQFIFSPVGSSEPIRVISSQYSDEPIREQFRWNNLPTVLFTIQINQDYLIENSSLQILLGSLMSQQIKLDHNREDWSDLLTESLLGQLRERYLTMDDEIREGFANFYQMVPGSMLFHYYAIFYMGIGATLAILAILSYPQDILGNPFAPLSPSFPLITAEPINLSQELGSYLQIIGKGLTSLPLKTLGVNLFNLSSAFYGHYLVHLPNSQIGFDRDMAMLEAISGVSTYYTQETFKVGEQLTQFRKELSQLEKAYQSQYARLEKSSDQILQIRNKHQLSAISVTAAIGTASCQAIMNVRDKTLGSLHGKREELIDTIYRETSGQIDRLRETGRNEIEILRGQLGYFSEQYNQIDRVGQEMIGQFDTSVKKLLGQFQEESVQQREKALQNILDEFVKLEERNKQQLTRCQQRWVQILQEMEQTSEQLKDQYVANLHQDALKIQTDLANTQKTTLQVIQSFKEKSQLNITGELNILKEWIDQRKMEWVKFGQELEDRLGKHLAQMNQIIEGRIEQLIVEITQRINNQLEGIINKRIQEAQVDFNKTVEELIIKRMEQSLTGKIGELDRKLRFAEKMISELQLQQQQLLTSQPMEALGETLEQLKSISSAPQVFDRGPNLDQTISSAPQVFDQYPSTDQIISPAPQGQPEPNLEDSTQSDLKDLRDLREVEFQQVKIERVNQYPIDQNPLSNLSGILPKSEGISESIKIGSQEKFTLIETDKVEKEGYLSDTQYGVGIDDQDGHGGTNLPLTIQPLKLNGKVGKGNLNKPITNKVSYRPGQVYQIKQIT